MKDHVTLENLKVLYGQAIISYKPELNSVRLVIEKNFYYIPNCGQTAPALLMSIILYGLLIISWFIQKTIKGYMMLKNLEIPYGQAIISLETKFNSVAKPINC